MMAVKEMGFGENTSPAELQNHVKEIQLLRSFKHINIVQYLGADVLQQDDESASLYIFMEWVPGGSIKSLIKRFGALPDSLVASYTGQLLCGVEYLHKKQHVHRDIKCENILVDESGCIKLADFGTCKHLKMNSMKRLGIKTSSFVGTPYFMAPEVLLEEGHDYAADIWSVGCTVLEMASGILPWTDLKLKGVASLLLHVRNQQVKPTIPQSISAQLRHRWLQNMALGEMQKQS
eukprot:g2059.t1